MPAIVVVGEALIDLFGEPGKTLAEVSSFTPRFGGAPANLAVAAARLGGDVGFVGKVGQDGFGDALRAYLSDFSIDVSGFRSDPLAATMMACVALPRPDQPEFLLYAGANVNLNVGDIDPDYFTDCRVLAFGSVTLAYASEKAVVHAAQLARNRNAQIVFDVNLRPTIWSSLDQARQRILEAIPISHVVKLNPTEAAFLFGDLGEERVAEEVLALGPDLCCLTLGERGAYYRSTTGARGRVDGFAVDVVDATGAGDAFLAGLAVKISESPSAVSDLTQAEITEFIKFANACGAFVATHLGAMQAPLTRNAAQGLQRAEQDRG
ncbi:MAG: carbohydrate kinase [Hyphomicrobiales bacterium]|nr:carbohydrate kinase [Hyphomicrobiales bacterium]